MFVKEAMCHPGLRSGKNKLFLAALHTFYLCFTSPWLRLTVACAMIILQKSDIAFDTGDPTL